MTAGEREYHRYKLTAGESVDADYTTTNAIDADHVVASFLESGGGGAPAFERLTRRIDGNVIAAGQLKPGGFRVKEPS